jgi:hypothetical protein
MECSRCNGKMLPNYISTDQGKCDMMICVNCGNAEDKVICENRGMIPVNNYKKGKYG